jgi:DnaJ-class molecular chaperone
VTPIDDPADPGIELLAALNHALGHRPAAPGECRDCIGLGVIPDVERAIRTERGAWKVCPTCFGGRQGGSA